MENAYYFDLSGKISQSIQQPDMGKTALAPRQSDAEKTAPGSRQPDAGKTAPGPRQSDAEKTVPGSRQPDAGKTAPGPRQPDAGKTAPGPRQSDAEKTVPGPRQSDMRKTACSPWQYNTEKNSRSGQRYNEANVSSFSREYGAGKTFHTDKNQKERIIYQSQMLHYGLYTPDPKKTSFSAIPWHWHDEFEFGHIMGGSILYKTNHQEFILQKGDGIFVNSGTLHSLQPLEPAGDVSLCTQFFDQSFLAGYPGSIYDVKYISPVQEAKSLDAVPLYHTRDKDAVFLEKIRQCEEISLKKAPFFELRIRNIFSELWETVYSWAMEQKNSEKLYDAVEDERIKQMLSVIQDRYGERLTVAELAGTAHISERECYRIFRNILGITPGNYIEIIRLQKAQELLRYTNKSILEIALETGFGTSSYFCKIFKVYHHITPSQYRKLEV